MKPAKETKAAKVVVAKSKPAPAVNSVVAQTDEEEAGDDESGDEYEDGGISQSTPSAPAPRDSLLNGVTISDCLHELESEYLKQASWEVRRLTLCPSHVLPPPRALLTVKLNAVSHQKDLDRRSNCRTGSPLPRHLGGRHLLLHQVAARP